MFALGLSRLQEVMHPHNPGSSTVATTGTCYGGEPGTILESDRAKERPASDGFE